MSDADLGLAFGRVHLTSDWDDQLAPVAADRIDERLAYLGAGFGHGHLARFREVRLRGFT
jgi:hypothetical protein